MITDTKEGTISDVEDNVFRQMVSNSCRDMDTVHGKEIVIVFDLMPTIKIYNYPIGTLAFTGQETKMSCEKVKLRYLKMVMITHNFFFLQLQLFLKNDDDA